MVAGMEDGCWDEGWLLGWRMVAGMKGRFPSVAKILNVRFLLGKCVMLVGRVACADGCFKKIS